MRRICRKCHRTTADPRGCCKTCEKRLRRYDIELMRQRKEAMLRQRGWIK